MSWASIILALLKIANILLTTAQQNKWIGVGEDREIAKQSAAILKKTADARKTLEAVSALDDKQVDDILHSLELRDVRQDLGG